MKALVLGSPSSLDMSIGAEDLGFQMFRESLPAEEGGLLPLQR